MQKRKALETVAIRRCMIENWGSESAPGDNDIRQDDGFIGSDTALETLIMGNQSLEALEAELEEWTAYRASGNAETEMEDILNLHWGAHQECATDFVAREGYSTMYSNEDGGEAWWSRFLDTSASVNGLTTPLKRSVTTSRDVATVVGQYHAALDIRKFCQCQGNSCQYPCPKNQQPPGIYIT